MTARFPVRPALAAALALLLSGCFGTAPTGGPAVRYAGPGTDVAFYRAQAEKMYDANVAGRVMIASMNPRRGGISALKEAPGPRSEGLSYDARMIADEALTVAAEIIELEVFRAVTIESVLDVCTPAELGSADPAENYASCVRRHGRELRYRNKHRYQDTAPKWKARLFRIAGEEMQAVAVGLEASPEAADEARLYLYDMTAEFERQERALRR